MNDQQAVFPYSSHAYNGSASDDSFLERHNSPRDTNTSNFTQENVGLSGSLGALGHFSSRDTSRHQYGSANAFADPSFGTHTEGRHTHDRHPTISPSAFDDRNAYDFPLLRGVEEYGERPRYDFRDREERRCDDGFLLRSDCLYNTSPRGKDPCALLNEPTEAMSSQLSSSEIPPGRKSKAIWVPFQDMFPSSECARNFRKAALRFDRQPYRPPESDPTIWKIENHRGRWAKSIYDAMIRPDRAKDNPKSNAMRRWVEDPFYESALVEAVAHKILDAVLAQVKDGFRGWKHNDYTQDERKGEVEDTEVSCEERLANVIGALEGEKTICEDVMNSTCQIRMFVNAPKAYAARKLNNRVGNSKRKRTRGPPGMETIAEHEEVSRPTKTRKQPARKAQQSSLSVSLPNIGECASDKPQSSHKEPALESHPSTPQQHASKPVSNHPGLGPTFSSNREQRYSSTAGTESQLHMAAMPSSYSHTAHDDDKHITRITSMPPMHNSTFMSPPPLSHFSASAPVTPEQPEAANAHEYLWQQTTIFGHALGPSIVNGDAIDPPLFSDPWNWSEAHLSCSSPGQYQTQYDPQLFSPTSLDSSEGTSFH